MQKQKNRVEVQGNNYHFALFKTKENADYSPEPRLCSFVSAQFETSLLLGMGVVDLFVFFSAWFYFFALPFSWILLYMSSSSSRSFVAFQIFMLAS